MATMNNSKLIFSNDRVYDRLKYATQIVLPGFGALYFGLSEIWGFAYGPEVVGTVTVLVTFLGVVLGLSQKAYQNSDQRYGGTVRVIEDAQTKNFQLEFDEDPYELDQKGEVLFKVKKDQA